MRSTSLHGAEARAQLDKFDRWAGLLDSQFSILGLRIGWDSILGLIPGVGDAITVVPSAAMLHAGYRAGIRKSAMANMVLNTGLDLAVGAVPLVGDLFDVAFKSHSKNAVILRREFGRKNLD
ncbi:DUF4112 domain-containing protein [uncultured Sulfitobacter sp.]|uniref:DUF4112 domain-containing protein n=1 Tax=uncultured Sulfitobacter sp. TaxID=191468 RepID=UPI002601A964|nr:DUF4112 domain-containing protein [uncultured Sulfitobacter sp.]